MYALREDNLITPEYKWIPIYIIDVMYNRAHRHPASKKPAV